MGISRRGFIAGLAVAGATGTAAYHAHKALTHDPEDDIVTPGEASVELADYAGQVLADHLRGIWDLRFEGTEAGLEGLPVVGVELFLDVATKGRGLRGFVDTGERLRSDGVARYRVLGDLVEASSAQVRWRLLNQQGGASYECIASLDEVWGDFANAGTGTLSGRLQRLDRPLMLPVADSRFVAVKRRFPKRASASAIRHRCTPGCSVPSIGCSTSFGMPPGTNGTTCPNSSAAPCVAWAGSQAHGSVSAMPAARASTAMARGSIFCSCTGICCRPLVSCRTYHPDALPIACAKCRARPGRLCPLSRESRWLLCATELAGAG